MAYFLDLSERADKELRGSNQAKWLRHLGEERDNLRSALEWAIETGQTESGLQMACHLSLFWFRRSDLSEGRQWLGRVALSQRDYRSAYEFLTRAAEIRLPEANKLFYRISLKTYGIATAYPLEAFAVLAVAQNQMERAARLFGAVESLYASIHFEMSAKERAEHDQAIASARVALGEEAFAQAVEEGRAVTVEQAIAYALEDQGSYCREMIFITSSSCRNIRMRSIRQKPE